MFALPISKPRLKALFFNQNIPKIKLFLQKNAKFSSARGGWGLCPHTPSLRRLPPLASGGWGHRPHTPKTAPSIAFLATRLYATVLYNKNL